MTGSHEVRGSIPLGSTNSINDLGHPLRVPFVVWCAYDALQPGREIAPPSSFRTRSAKSSSTTFSVADQ